MSNLYTPSMGNKKTRSKIRHAIGFAEMFLRDNKPRNLARNLLNERLGRSNDDLGAFLRSKVLICVDERYSKDSGLTKAYIRNNQGVEYLKSLLITSKEESNESITKSIINEFVEGEWSEELSTGDFKYTSKSERHHHAIQNLPKALRGQILAQNGYQWDYDIEAATITLLVQQARNMGMTDSVPALDQLISDKALFRRIISDDLEISTESAKELISAIVNGAKVGITNKHSKFCVYDILGQDRARVRLITGIDEIQPHELIAQFRSDMKKVWTALRPMAGNIERVKTARGYRNKPMSSSQKAYIYRLLETRVMDVVSEYLTDMLEVRHFRIHDGFTAVQSIDETELADWVFMKTGFQVKFSCVFLESTSVANARDVSVDEEIVLVGTSLNSSSTIASPVITQYNTTVSLLHSSVRQLFDLEETQPITQYNTTVSLLHSSVRQL